MTKLAAAEVAALDPYKFMATIGKRVIHPGGRVSTEALLARALITATIDILPVLKDRDSRGRLTPAAGGSRCPRRED